MIMKKWTCLVIGFVVQLAGVEFMSGQVLTHGPVVGGVSASEAKVFVRTSQAASIQLRYGTDPNLQSYSTSSTLKSKLKSDFTGMITLTSLTSETTYYLNPVVNGTPQLSAPYPSFKTFPPQDSARDFSFAVLTDFTTVKNLTTDVPTYASAGATNPAFVFIGGDFDHRDPRPLPIKRQMFKDLYDPNTRFMGDFVNLILHRFPIVHQWDDHDAGENNLDKDYASWSLSQQVFEEYVPSYPLPAVTPGIWQSFSYAQADFFVLDCRSQRDNDFDHDNANKSMLDGNALGATGQLQWLENGLLASQAVWKVIFTSVVTNPTTKFPDGWSGFQTEWNALKDFINGNNIQNVVFISGDLHLGAIDNGAASGFPEMCVGQPNGEKTGYCGTSHAGQWSEGYYPDTCTSFGLVKISDNPDQLTLQAVDQDGVVQISYTIPAAH
jgi:alkaline phosphatase D